MAVLPLRHEPAGLVHRLRPQADVAHHGHARVDETRHERRHPRTALDLDRLRTALLERAPRVAHRVVFPRLVTHERHVEHDVRPLAAAHDGARVMEHFVHHHFERVRHSENDHRDAVADEQNVDTRLLGEARHWRVVRGEAHDAAAFGLEGLDLRSSDSCHGGCNLADCGRTHQLLVFSSSRLLVFSSSRSASMRRAAAAASIFPAARAR